MAFLNGNRSGDVSISRRNTPLTIETCSQFVGKPLSREQALAKMERSPQFMEAAQHFGSSLEQDIVQNAVQLDYGLRLRNCLAAGNSPNHHSGDRNNHNMGIDN